MLLSYIITSSISHITTFSTVLCLNISLAVDPSPPPIMQIALGLKCGSMHLLNNVHFF